MRAEPQHEGTHPRPEPATEPATGPFAAGAQQERDDIEEDRRRQHELDDAELGGEA
jgi:hypothetical protein